MACASQDQLSNMGMDRVSKWSSTVVPAHIPHGTSHGKAGSVPLNRPTAWSDSVFRTEHRIATANGQCEPRPIVKHGLGPCLEMEFHGGACPCSARDVAWQSRECSLEPSNRVVRFCVPYGTQNCNRQW